MKKIRFFKNKEQTLLNCLKKEPRNPESYLKLGKLYFLHGDYEKAQAVYEQGLRADSRNISLLFNCAVTREARNQFAEAKELYLKILSLVPDHQAAQERLDKVTAF